MDLSGLYFITDRKLSSNGIVDDVWQVVSAGAKVVQYREKEAGEAWKVKEARIIKEICREKNVVFIINDDLEVAKTVGADGVHLGQQDTSIGEAKKILGKGKIIGVTVHNEKEAADAENAGANYLGVSPIFDTSTKKDAGEAIGIEELAKIRAVTELPLVAIGGISYDNMEEVLRAGAEAVAIISAILNSNDIALETRRVVKKINEIRAAGK